MKQTKRLHISIFLWALFAFTLVCYGKVKGMENMEIRLSLFSYSPLIDIVIKYKKLDDNDPESLNKMLTYSLKLPKGSA